MKLLVSEVLYPEGHKYYNERLIKVLSTIGEILLLDDGDYYNSMSLPESIIREKIKHKLPSVERFYKVKKYLPFIKYEPLLLLSYIRYYYRVSRIAKKHGINKIILLTVQNNALALSLPFFCGMKVYVFHHNDIDEIHRRAIDWKLFRFSMNRVYHMVLAEFIKDGLEEVIGVESDRVFVVHEPSSMDNNPTNVSFTDRKNVFVGLSSTCDKAFLNEFIACDKKYIDRLPYAIVLRNKEKEYLGNNLEVINRYLSREEFDEFLTKSTACLVLYPQNFKLRYSGIIDDAMNNGLSVYGTDIPVMRYFANEYPLSCHVLSGIEECFTEMQENVCLADREEIKRFYHRHTLEYVRIQLLKALEQ